MKSFFVSFFFVNICLLQMATGGPSVTDNHIKVDQFGYQTAAKKLAVISNPKTGFNSSSSFTPGTTYQVRRWNDDVSVFSGSPTQFNSGNTDPGSGDQTWWFDFSSLTTPGTYYIFDVSKNVGSYAFDINDCVYNTVMKHVVRSFYYQRCGVSKPAAYASAGWADSACHVGNLQDKDCRQYNNTNISTSKDLSGGWHDAGDYSKYVNFTWATLIDLLLAYEENTTVWTDDYGIPESGNGIPDLLDEIKFELDWLLRMQQSNGSVLSIVGSGGGSPPSSDNSQRKYGLVNTSATLTCAGVFALAAKQYRSLGIAAMTTYSNTLETAATNAWTWANNNPNVQFRNNDGANGSSGLGAGQQEVDDYGRLTRKVAAACFLYALTGTASYKTFFDANYSSVHLILWSDVSSWEPTEQDALLYYTKISGATTSVVNNIKSKFTSSMTGKADNYPSHVNKYDPYIADIPTYTWGSNATKARQGNLFYNMLTYGMDAANSTGYKNAAESYIHYIQGVNPLAFVYLTNMNSYGAENSVAEIYHEWFKDGSAQWDRAGTSTYGPAPGFLPGGPNPSYDWDGCCPSGCGSSANNAICTSTTISPPKGQPDQKSYKDFNTGWPLNSWAVTENGIYYQAAYVKLLSKACSSCVVTNHPVVTEKSTVTVYPNPVEDFLTVVSGGNNITQVRILNLLGQECTTTVITANKSSDIFVPTLSLIQGVYLLEVKTTGGTSFHKFIRK